MGVSAGFRAAQLPQAQPFFELPFNELLGAMSARQQRYDAVTESTALAKAELAKIQAIPGSADEDYLVDKQTKLNELINTYVDKDLSKQPGVDLMRNIRDLATDPNFTTISDSYKGWSDQMANEQKLQMEGQYDPNLVDYSWQKWDSSKMGAYRGYAESWNPEDLKQYADNMPGSEMIIDENGATMWRITDKDVRNRSIEVGQNFLDEGDGRKWVKIDRRRTDQNTTSLLYPDRTYEELTDEELAQDIIYRSIREFVGDDITTKYQGKKSSGSGYKIQDAYNILGVGSEGVGIEPVTGLGFSQSTAEQIIGSFEATAKYKETDAGIKQGLKNAGAQNLSGNGVPNPEVISNTTLDKFEFLWVEERGGKKILTWNTKGDVGPTQTEIDQINRMISKNESLIRSMAQSIETDRQTALRGREVVREVNQASGVDPNYKPTKEQTEQFNVSVKSNYVNGIINSVGGGTGPWDATLNTIADLMYNDLPQDQIPFSKENLRLYLTGGKGISGIGYDEEVKYNLIGLLRKHTESVLVSNINMDKSIATEGERASALAGVESMLLAAEESAYSNIKDPKYQKVARAWKQYTKDLAYITTPYYDFGASTEGEKARKSLENLIDPGIRNKTISIYDTQSNKYVPFTEEFWLFWTKDRWSNGKFNIVGWRPDRSKTSNGTVILVEYRDKNGVSDGRMYEVRKNVGLANYLSHDPELADDVHFMTEASKLNNGLAENNNWKSVYQMDPSLPPVTVYALQNDVLGGDGKIQFPKGGYKFITPEGKLIYASHEKEFFDKYREEMKPHFSTLVNRVQIEAMAQSANVVPNYSSDPTKGQILPYGTLQSYVQSADVNIPDTFTLMVDNPNLVIDIIQQESQGDYTIVNPASGASGLTGVLPSTAAAPGYGVKALDNVFNPQENVRFAKEYLLAMSNRYQGDVALVLAAYSGGPVVADALKRANKNVAILKTMGKPGEQAYNYLKDFQNLRGYDLNLSF